MIPIARASQPSCYAPSMSEISPQARALINGHISSVAQLELLLLLRLRPEQWWTPASLDQELRLNEPWIATLLSDFCGRGFCEQTSDPTLQFRYRPESPELAQAVDVLAQDYLIHRVSVINAIYSKPAAPIQ